MHRLSSRWSRILLLPGVCCALAPAPATAAVPFDPPAVIDAASDGPASVALGDVDRDGDLDVVSASSNDGALVWHANGGAGASWTPTPIGVVAGARYVVAIDLDQDGDLDVASISPSGVAWHEQDPNGWFAQPIGAANGPRIAIADLDRDGDLDVLAAASDSVEWYENALGDASSWVAHTLDANAPGAFGVVAADLDADGDLDVVTSSSSAGSVEWHENLSGDASSWLAHPIAMGVSGARPVVARDLDGDGAIDVAVGHATGIEWHRNAARDGSAWTSAPASGALATVQSLAAVDVDRDGDLDLVSAASAGNSLVWHENANGDASVWADGPVDAAATDARAVRAGDLDGNGSPDLVGAAFGADEVRWYASGLAPRHSVFGSTVIIDGLTGSHQVSAVDMDGDGDADVLSTARSLDTVAWFENVTGDSTQWGRRIISTTASNVWSADAADFDGDADLDVAVAARNAQRVLWYESLPDYAWAEHVVTFVSPGVRAVLAVDLDADQNVDVVAGGDDENITWYKNTAGDGSVWDPVLIKSENATIHKLSAADLDGDQDPDVIAAFGNAAYWYENDGGGSDWPRHLIGGALDVRWVDTGDLDGDNDLDVVLMPFPATALSWYENDANGITFTPHLVDPNFPGGSTIEASDLDGDTDLDLLVATQTTAYWYENTGLPGAWPTHLALTGENPTAAVAADLDGDNDADVAVALADFGVISALENDAGGQVWTRNDITHGGTVPQAIATGDVDRDGDLDVVVGHRSVPRIFVYLNRGTSLVTFDRVVVSESAGDTWQVTLADLDRDGDLDIAAATLDRIDWYENVLGDGTQWVTRTVLGALPESRGVQAGDLDGDGDPDLVHTSRIDGVVRWVENLADANAWVEHLVAPADFAAKTRLADVDSDGDLDIVFVAERESFGVQWQENRDDAQTWVTHLISDFPQKPRALAVGDLDRDGDVDVAVASRNDDMISWYENSSGGLIWTLHVLLDNPDYNGGEDCEPCDEECGFADGAVAIEAVDLDLDGDLDLMGTGTHSERAFWLENAAGDASLWATHLVHKDFPRNIRWTTIGDLDGDSAPDAISGGKLDNYLVWTPNQLLPGVLPVQPVCADGIDNDADCLTDAEDPACVADPNSPSECTDTDGDGVSDCYDEDDDNDGLSDVEEQALGTDPRHPDTDRDGLVDSDEIGLYGTDPLDPDTDGDGVSDGREIAAGLDPLDPTDSEALPALDPHRLGLLALVLLGALFVRGRLDRGR